MASSSANSKVHTSPSKASYGRTTYDSKLVSREMHRLGNLAHLPAGLAPGLSQAPSVTSLALPAPGSMAQVSLASTASADPWGALHVQVLPLFNREPLRIPIEDLNGLVKRHIQSVVSSSPSKAIATLEHDAAELIASGMVTLNSKLAGTDDEALIRRVIETWSFFWDEVLTYLEGVLLPLHTETILSTLYRGKPHRPSSPRQTSKSNIPFMNGSSSLPSNYIDVRTIALRSFRDKVVVPLAPRLRTCIINRQEKENISGNATAQAQAQDTATTQPRLQQMLLVLTSQSCRRAPPMSLTSAPPQPSAGEQAVADLLRAVRSPRPQFDAKAMTTPISPARAPSFLSGGLPRDRRGRVAQKNLDHVGIKITEEDEDMFGDETPRVAQGLKERERGREFLEALRSPDIDGHSLAVKGGWGLGPGGALDSGKPEEEEDEPLNWDEAQAVVERMVGMSMNGQSEMRRRP